MGNLLADNMHRVTELAFGTAQAKRSVRAAARGGPVPSSAHMEAGAPGFDKARGCIATKAGASNLTGHI